jgi:hypothetical protein
VVLKWRYSGVTVVLQWCCSGVTVVLISRVFAPVLPQVVYVFCSGIQFRIAPM